MATTDKSAGIDDIVHADLKRLGKEQLQQRLEDYFEKNGDASAHKLVNELLHELQAHQVKLEMQNQDLQESQRLLEEARDRYADLYDFAPVCYITFDAFGCMHEINLAGATMLGQERSLLLDKPISMYLTKPSQRLFFNHLKAVHQCKQVMTQELQLKTASGEILEVQLETVTNPEFINGKPSYRCVVIDITWRKQAEREMLHHTQQLRVITDTIPAYIAYIDRDERYQFVNKAYREWFNSPQERFIGKTVKEVVGDEYYARIAHSIHRVLAGGPVNFEWTVINPNDVEQVVNTSYIPDIAEDGAVMGYFVLSRDMTEQRQLEASEKLRMLEMARVTRINTMGEMVAELAHELNQPLAAITIYSDAVSRMLSKETLQIQDIQKALNEIRLQAGRAGDVISRLREFISKRELQSEPIHINSLVEEVMKLIAVEARWHGVEVILEMGGDIPQITVDRILIEQVVLNLARNAIEAMASIERDKRQVIIRTVLGNYNEIELSVEDNGPGMPIEEMEKIFEPFYTSKTHGMGMGLAISRSIIKAHHGRLWAIPNEHGGTTFTIILLYQTEADEP